jgi:putative ABC transport system substrate-binding protein
MDVDVIVAAGTPAVLAARAVTQKTPIVMVAVSDPVGGGLVASLARPGGRLTGIAAFGPELGAKRLEVLKEIVPKVQKIAVLLNQANPAVLPIWDETRLAAAALDLLVEPVDVQAPEALERAFANVLGKRPSALLLLPDPTVFTHQRQIAEFALRNHLPAMSAFREFPAAGGLLSYGPSIPAIAERGAIYVAKILKGAKPADLPVEQPTRFELVINLKTPRPPASRSRRRCWRGRTR